MSLKEYFQINVFTVQASFEYEYVAQIKNGSFARRFTRLHKKLSPAVHLSTDEKIKILNN